MARMYGGVLPGLFDVKRSTLSGTYTLTAAWQTIYTDSSTQPFSFLGGFVNLSNMQAGDTVQIRVRRIEASGGAYVLHDIMTYTDAMPANHPVAPIDGLFNMYGVEVSIIQSVGAFRNVTAEFFYGKKAGM